jgi:hypothetical protein
MEGADSAAAASEGAPEAALEVVGSAVEWVADSAEVGAASAAAD